MRIGVPGEFHEDRWQRTAEDSERCMLPRTREVGGTHRIQVIAWQSVLLTGLRHGAHFHNHLRAIPAWRRSHLSGLWHCDPAHRYLSGILAWRSDTKPMPNRSMNGVNGWLRHGHPAYRHLSGIPAWRSIIQPVSDRSLSDALVGPSARRPSSKASQGLVLCNEYRFGDFRVREG